MAETVIITYLKPLLQAYERQLSYLMHESQQSVRKMKKQKNIFQMKEKDKTLEKDLNEMEVTDLPYTLQNNRQNNWSLRSGDQHMNKVRISIKKHK